jgi:hypothetical protein
MGANEISSNGTWAMRHASSVSRFREDGVVVELWKWDGGGGGMFPLLSVSCKGGEAWWWWDFSRFTESGNVVVVDSLMRGRLRHCAAWHCAARPTKEEKKHVISRMKE